MQGRRQIRGGKGVRGADEEEKLVNIYQGRVIVGAALLEGAAFMGGIAYMVERSLPGLAVAIICIAAILLWDFPNRSRMGEWLDEQKRLLHAGQ
ncbi:MAG: hypothetical protein HC813_00305 [Planctomycetes bacterium]|nr:hypothetical protein [Planctomycetota bacterium]